MNTNKLLLQTGELAVVIKKKHKMNLDHITQEVKKHLPKDLRVYTNTKRFKFYTNLSGFLDDSYFDLFFMEDERGLKIIEISPTTENPLKYVEMIKSIDNKAVIKFHKTTSEEVIV